MWGGVGEYGCLGTGIGCVDICEDERGRGVLGDDSVIVYYRSHGRLRADMVVSGPGSRVRVFFFCLECLGRFGLNVEERILYLS